MQLKPSSTKIMTPITAVAICAPARDLMRFSAQRPNAAAPPERFISTTSVPSRITKTRMRACEPSVMPAIRPPLSWNSIVWNASSALPPAYRNAPTATPMNSEEYTSFVMNASVMATSGGSRDQKVE